MQDFTPTRGHLLTSVPRPSSYFYFISLGCCYAASLSSSSFSRVLSSLLPVYPRKSTSLFSFIYSACSSDHGHCELMVICAPLPEISVFIKQRSSNRERETETWPSPKKFTQNGDKLNNLNSWRK